MSDLGLRNPLASHRIKRQAIDSELAGGNQLLREVALDLVSAIDRQVRGR